ncbi:MAG5620 family putative phospho-sugar mutase [Mycoplasmopsis columbinasalis]|uniref:MAG5620 family putative phospho-sugar mutase n=1 Tax=Mycoplasmopsis columbinasalis TaxID=114880 RepID=UPI00101D6418|nr:hypothetical protein [Mycoplasmopsis columbinasalis]
MKQIKQKKLIDRLKIQIVNDFLVLEKPLNGKKLNYSLNLLAQAIQKTLNINSKFKLFISYQGMFLPKKIFQNVLDYFSFFCETTTYNSLLSIPLELDYYAQTKLGYDFLIKAIYHHKLKKLVIKLVNFNEEIPVEKLTEIVNIYQTLNEYSALSNRAKSNSLNIAQLLHTLSDLKTGLTKDFVSLKERYKTQFFINSRSIVARNLATELFTNYKNNYQLGATFFPTYISTWFWRWRLKTKKNKNLTAVYDLDFNDNLEAWFVLNQKLKKLNNLDLALFFLYFFLEEFKFKKTSLDDHFVVISHESSYKIVELLKLYKVKYYFYNNQTINEYLQDPNCLFVFTNKTFIITPTESLPFQNYYFLLYLTIMHNSYKNRNNLLTFKYRQVLELFGLTKSLRVHKKFKQEKLYFLLRAVRTIFNSFNSGTLFNNLIVHNKQEKDRIILFQFTSEKHHTMTWSYDLVAEKIQINYDVCFQYNFKSNGSHLNFLKMWWLSRKIFKQTKKLYRSYQKTKKQTKA